MLLLCDYELIRKEITNVLNGTKFWITNRPDADFLVVYTKTEPKAETKGITAFLVEKTFPGFSASPKLDKLGVRGSNTSELVFDNCPVPAKNVLGEVNKGIYIIMNCLDVERILFSAIPVGIMQACCDVAFDYVHQREAFGMKIGQFRMMQGKIADMCTSLNVSRSYLYNVVRAATRGNVNPKYSSSLFLHCGEAGTQVAMQAIQCLDSANGYINDYPTGRYLRDAKLYEIGGGTIEIRRMVVGRALNKEYMPNVTPK